MSCEDVFIFYHKNCYDGFGAAWVAYQKFGDRAHYIPRYWEDTEKISVSDKAKVYFLDVALPRQEMIELERHCSELIVLDHHKTAKERLQDLPYVYFDIEKSGTKLAWEYFFPEKSPPELLNYIEDRDLWRFNLPHSKEVNAALESYPMDFSVWNDISVANLIRDGETVLRFRAQQIEIMCAQAFWVELYGHKVPIVNATLFYSETASALCKKYPEAPFSAYFYVKQDGMIHVGLRSRGDFDVSVVASYYGGGGHKNAAGFGIAQKSYENLLNFERTCPNFYRIS